jgi:peptide/nickel transport system permease protein
MNVPAIVSNGRVGRGSHIPWRVWFVIALLVIVAIVALAGAAVTPYDPLSINMANRFLPPTFDHPFGTDDLGRDVLSRTMAGTGIALQAAATVLVIAVVIGTITGLIAGYYGGLADEGLMRVTDVFIAFPGLVLAMAITAALGPNLTNAMIALGVVWWPVYARLVRGQVLLTREADYVIAARTVGATDLRIIRDHVLPAIGAPVLVYLASDFGQALLTSASLSFIGLGAQPPTPEWGSMVSLGRAYLVDAWWISTFPGLAMVAAVSIFNSLPGAFRSATSSRDS